MIYLYKRKSIFDRYKLVSKFDSFKDAKGMATVNISNGYDILLSTSEIKEVKKHL